MHRNSIFADGNHTVLVRVELAAELVGALQENAYETAMRESLERPKGDNDR